MTVQLIAKTQTVWNPRKLPGKALDSNYQNRLVGDMHYDYDGVARNQEMIEFAGRLCYESFHLPNPATYDQSGYVSNIMEQRHHSVLEHIQVSFYVEKVSRNLSHELIRHRHLSFSEISQRYVSLEEADFVNPPAIKAINPRPQDDEDDVEHWKADTQPLDEDDLENYRQAMQVLAEQGIRGKKAREAARYYLPSGTETKFVVSGNLRAWYDVILKRRSPAADAEMQEFAEKIYQILSQHYPDVYAGM